MDDRLVALEGQAQALVDQLRELNADRHKYDDETFQREKTRLELAAAEAFKSRDGRKSELAKSAKATRKSKKRSGASSKASARTK